MLSIFFHLRFSILSDTWVPSPQSNKNRSPSLRTRADVRKRPGSGIMPPVPNENTSKFTSKIYQFNRRLATNQQLEMISMISEPTVFLRLNSKERTLDKKRPESIRDIFKNGMCRLKEVMYAPRASRSRLLR